MAKNRRMNVAVAAVAAVVLAAIVESIGVTPTSAADPVAGPGRWSRPPLPVDAAVLLNSVALDKHTTWAAGAAFIPGTPNPHGAVFDLHPLLLGRDDRDGGKWTRIPTPADSQKGRINSISAASPQDVWLGGDYDKLGNPQAKGIVTEHWDGHHWQIKTAPVPADVGAAGIAGTAGFLGIAAVTPTDAWGVGWSIGTGNLNGLLEHWNGTTWTRVAAPDAAQISILYGVSALAPNDVWAVGNTFAGQPVLMHYDGHGWTHVPNPSFSGPLGQLNAVTGHDHNDVYAVGFQVNASDGSTQALVLHWNGHQWRSLAAPDTAGDFVAAANTPDGILAVGADSTGYAATAVRYRHGNPQPVNLPTPDAGYDTFPSGVSTNLGFNGLSQHLIVEGVVDHDEMEQVGATEAWVAGYADDPARDPASVLAGDRSRCAYGRSIGGSGRVAGGRSAVVRRCWRRAPIESGRAVGPVSVLRRAGRDRDLVRPTRRGA